MVLLGARAKGSPEAQLSLSLASWCTLCYSPILCRVADIGMVRVCCCCQEHSTAQQARAREHSLVRVSLTFWGEFWDGSIAPDLLQAIVGARCRRLCVQKLEDKVNAFKDESGLSVAAIEHVPSDAVRSIVV
jgi:hypothetical protein